MYISDNFQSCLLTHLILARRPRSDLTGYIFEITTSVYHLISADYLALCTSLLLVLSNLSVFVQRTLDLGKCFGMPWPILEYISTNCIIIRINNLHWADMFSYWCEVVCFNKDAKLSSNKDWPTHFISSLLHKDCVIEN